MPNLINQLILRELKTGFEKADGMVFVALSKLSVAETEDLRDQLAAGGVRLRVVRNTLARRALMERGIEPPAELFQGVVGACAGSAEHAIHAAKVVAKSAAKKAKKVEFKGGYLEGRLLGAAEAAQLAELPGKQELRAMLLGLLSAPARSLASLVNQLPSSTVRVIQARVDQGGGGAA